MTTYPDPETISTQAIASDDLADKLVESTGFNLVETIETVIASLDQGGGAMVNRTEGSHLWKFKYGSVEVFVQLTGTTDEDTLTVWAPVLALPARNEPQLLRHLLEMNWLSTFEARFGISQNQVVVLTTRSVADLSAGEISRAITIVATIADDNDEALAAEFGAA